MSPLGILISGEIAEVRDINGHVDKNDLLARLGDMGLRPGKIVEVISNNGRDPVLVKIGESRIAISRKMAMKIMMRRIK